MFKHLAKPLPILIAATAFATPAAAGDNGIAAVIHSLRAEAGRVCQVGHFHVGKSPVIDNKQKAMKAAIRHWSTFTVAEYGTDWGRYSFAANRSSDCYREGAHGWVCKVKARPCRKGYSTAAR